MKDEELIGKKVYGFKFPEGRAALKHTKIREDFFGVEGEIVKVDEANGRVERARVQVKFPLTGDQRFPLTGGQYTYFWYPYSMIKDYLIEKSENSNPLEIFKIL